MKNLLQGNFDGIKMYYRDNRTDRNVIREVIENHGYRRAKYNFDVELGEKWLDLGANIGAFAAYAIKRGAKLVHCYEPDAENAALCKKNTEGHALVYQRAVTADPAGSLQLYASPIAGSASRYTTIHTGRFRELAKVLNTYCGALKDKYKYDGIKMDIEGAEGRILDDELLPYCKKLVLEYHTSRDASVANFKRRLNILYKYFEFVRYPVEFDNAIIAGLDTYKPFCDRLWFAWGPRG